MVCSGDSFMSFRLVAASRKWDDLPTLQMMVVTVQQMRESNTTDALWPV